MGTAYESTKEYRYLLTRSPVPQGTGVVTFVMLNPSTADESKNDATITRCEGHARNWGFGTMHVVNLSPFRSTEADRMLKHATPPDVMEKNLRCVVETAKASNLVVVAWGVKGWRVDAYKKVVEELKGIEKGIRCLKPTKDGYPHHPVGLESKLPLDSLPCWTGECCV